MKNSANAGIPFYEKTMGGMFSIYQSAKGDQRWWYWSTGQVHGWTLSLVSLSFLIHKSPHIRIFHDVPWCKAEIPGKKWLDPLTAKGRLGFFSREMNVSDSPPGVIHIIGTHGTQTKSNKHQAPLVFLVEQYLYYFTNSIKLRYDERKIFHVCHESYDVS